MSKVKASPVRIEKIRVRDLYSFACDLPAGEKENELIPITRQRALAQSRNPCAAENDIGLLVAYVGDRCAGYCGFIPGWLRIKNQLSKVYWVSALFVLPEFRRRGVGLYLLRMIYRLKSDCCACNMSKEAERVVRGMKFREMGVLKYYILSFNRMGPAVKGELYRRLFRRRKRCLRKISWREVDRVQTSRQPLPAANLTRAEFYRGEEVINWMLRYKWLVETGAREEPNSNYMFSEGRDIFKYIALEIYSADQTIYKGFLVLSLSSVNSETTLKILDFRFGNPADRRYILPLAMRYARGYRADFVHLPENIFQLDKNHLLMRYLAHRKQRFYFGHLKDKQSPLAAACFDITLNYCDGDTPFT